MNITCGVIVVREAEAVLGPLLEARWCVTLTLAPIIGGSEFGKGRGIDRGGMLSSSFSLSSLPYTSPSNQQHLITQHTLTSVSQSPIPPNACASRRKAARVLFDTTANMS